MTEVDSSGHGVSSAIFISYASQDKDVAESICRSWHRWRSLCLTTPRRLRRPFLPVMPSG